MKLIGLCGRKFSGKDTVGLRLAHHGFLRYAFADPLKEAAGVLLDIDKSVWTREDFDKEAILPNWGFSARWFWQVLGTECVRNTIDPDFWVKRMGLELDRVKKNETFYRYSAKIVITDVRFQSEVDMLYRLGGKLVQVCRGKELIKDSHISENWSFEPSYVINNDGTLEDLNKVVDNLVLELGV